MSWSRCHLGLLSMSCWITPSMYSCIKPFLASCNSPLDACILLSLHDSGRNSWSSWDCQVLRFLAILMKRVNLKIKWFYMNWGLWVLWGPWKVILVESDNISQKKEVVDQVGSELSDVMVLDQSKNSPLYILTHKRALCNATRPAQLPSSIEDLMEGQQLYGFVANITADAIFVRFLGGLTGRAGDFMLLCLFKQKIQVVLLEQRTKKFGKTSIAEGAKDLKPDITGSLLYMACRLQHLRSFLSRKFCIDHTRGQSGDSIWVPFMLSDFQHTIHNVISDWIMRFNLTSVPFDFRTVE